MFLSSVAIHITSHIILRNEMGKRLYLSSDLCINFTREIHFLKNEDDGYVLIPPDGEANFYGIALGE